MTNPTLPPVTLVDIDEVKPYWRNPRRVPEEAVNAVAKSIADYGYNQPIVVDTDKVIIIGHTRYAALRRLDVKQVPIAVVEMSATKAKELRVIDNRSAEFTSWDFDALMNELRDLDGNVLTAFFPEVDPEGMTAEPMPREPVGPSRSWDDVVPQVEFVCPHCFHSFETTVTPEAVRSGTLKAAKEQAS